MVQLQDENFICARDVDKSLLRQGFTLPVKMLWNFTNWFGVLKPGEARDVVVRLRGKEFHVRLGNRNFSRETYPNHPEMYQMRYSGAFPKALQEVFKSTADFVQREMQTTGKRRHIDMSRTKREKIFFYRTDDPLVWDAEVQTVDEMNVVSQMAKGIDERIFELANWTDENAGILLKPAVVKVRRLDRAIGDNLKHVYSHRCQICGEQVADAYSTHVDEVHHIDPFVTSLNNDVSNLLVLCPNHHRIIHSAHPEFCRKSLSFFYPNGLEEGLKVNLHLVPA